MRIIAGLAKGRRLLAPPGLHTRPTAGRVREALFSVIMPRLAGARVLDAFAGSGALGLEALSRGAGNALFIERDAAALKILRRNAENCRLPGVRIVPGDALRFLRLRHEPFDIIFLDPPYRTDLLARALAALPGQLLAAGGLIVAETAAKQELRPPGGLSVIKHSVYGDTALYYLQAVDLAEQNL
jgi:16S rRNA (guanine966-N2)-methyltransferase